MLGHPSTQWMQQILTRCLVLEVNKQSKASNRMNFLFTLPIFLNGVTMIQQLLKIPPPPLSREAGVCEEKGCIFKELLSIKLTDAFLKDHVGNGFQVSISSKARMKSDLYVPPEYIKGYLKAVDGKN